MPAAGGTRLLLVATDPDIDKRAQEDRSLAAGPAQPGIVVIGEQSRFVFEFGDGSLSVFNLLQLRQHGENTGHAAAAHRVRSARRGDRHGDAEGLVAAGNGRGQEGHSRSVRSRPASRNIQFAYSLPYSSSSLTVEQPMPVPLNRVIVLAQKIADMRLASAQMTEQREMAADGQTYVVGQGPAVRAGERSRLQFHEPAARGAVAALYGRCARRTDPGGRVVGQHARVTRGGRSGVGAGSSGEAPQSAVSPS